jgi:uncharacterized membrane protein
MRQALAAHVRARPRLYLAAAAGLAAALLAPDLARVTTRALLGWNVAVWLYLVLMAHLMARADHGRLREVAAAQAEGAAVVLGVVVTAAVASVVAIGVELAAVKAQGARAAWPHLLFAVSTVVGSWLLLPTLFSLDYASLFYREAEPGGLVFPGADAAYRPDYTDFLYFAATIAVASQTADVAVSSRPLRRLVLVQSVLSFAFNAAILALTVNIAAGLF